MALGRGPCEDYPAEARRARAMDHDEELLESYMKKCRYRDAALRFLSTSMKRHEQRPDARDRHSADQFRKIVPENFVISLGNALSKVADFVFGTII
jgi:hypothetical protein